jgi:hypothetical protein
MEITECSKCLDIFNNEFEDGYWVYDTEDSGNWLCNFCFGESQ